MKFSLCMIVKNEEAVLRNCLDSLKDLMDEIIIVDTGSTDTTKDIAREYTQKIYDFEWINDFSAARNFAFSKATGDYIYSADADEIIDEENRQRFRILKQAMMPEIDIVQMVYVTEQPNHPTENFVRDFRPKLFKRIREFRWIEAVHETVNINPVVYDSDIEIIHRPQGNHSSRDFLIFERVIAEKGDLSDRLLGMYLRELYKAGEQENLFNARTFLEDRLKALEEAGDEALARQTIAVLLKIYRLADEPVQMLKMSLKSEVTVPSAEICMELGSFFMDKEDYKEAWLWFERAAFNCESEIDIRSSGVGALGALARSIRCYSDSLQVILPVGEEHKLEITRLDELASEYEQMVANIDKKI